VNRTFSWRLSLGEKYLDPRDIEREVDCGQIEELITQSEDELELIPQMAKTRPWDVDPKRKIPIVVRVPPGGELPYDLKVGVVKAVLLPKTDSAGAAASSSSPPPPPPPPSPAKP
jgi:hypothetical protein